MPTTKEAERMRNEHTTRRQQIIRQHSLTQDELDRINTLDPNDDVSNYAGHFETQVRIVVSERPEPSWTEAVLVEQQAGEQAVRREVEIDIPPNIILGEE